RHLLTAKAQLAVGPRDDAGTRIAQRDMRAADVQWTPSIGVRNPHPQGVAAETGAHGHAQGLVGEGAGFGGCRSRGPGADPMLVLRHIVSPGLARCGGPGKSYARGCPAANAKRRRSRMTCSSCFIRSRSGTGTPIMTIPHPHPLTVPYGYSVNMVIMWLSRSELPGIGRKGAPSRLRRT